MGSYEKFEVAFKNKYWSEEDQESLRSKIMGTENFGRVNNHLTIYVMKIFNEAKYLEPPLPFRSFVRHISKHLPREVQITLMTREIVDINELENMLDVLQNIGEREVGRRPNPPAAPNNENYHQYRGTPNSYRGTRGSNNHNFRGGMWKCLNCEYENYAIRTVCYRYEKYIYIFKTSIYKMCIK